MDDSLGSNRELRAVIRHPEVGNYDLDSACRLMDRYEERTFSGIRQ